MKKILGLDLGTNSIGWARVNEAESDDEKSSIIKLGVRTIKYDNFVSTNTGKECLDPVADFNGGKGISPNAGRTNHRSARRNLQRYKLRREHLVKYLKESDIINEGTLLCEDGNKTTFQTYRQRAKAATECIPLEDFAKVLLMINKKRGYKSSRKAKSNEDGQLIDGMSIAITLYEKGLTPGQFVLDRLKHEKKYIPDFYKSDLQNEFDKIWECQKNNYPEILTDEFKSQLSGRGRNETSKLFLGKYEIYTALNKGKDKRLQSYIWRVDALSQKMDIDIIAYVLSELNGLINNTSGYLGAISDRSKNLYFNHLTVGQFLMAKLDENPNASLKNQVFYRQDYLDEFEMIWETQAKFYPELTPELKKDIRDIAIFYQRPLRSQKGLVDTCELERKEVDVMIDGKLKHKTVGYKVCPKSSPLFQEFKIWHVLNNICIKNKQTNESALLVQEQKDLLYKELSIKGKMSKTEVLKLLFENYKEFDLNFKDVEGNRTQAAFFKAYQNIISLSGNGEYDFSKMNAKQVIGIVKEIFDGLGFKTDMLIFDSSIEGKDFDKQPLYLLWHLLYSYEGDNSRTGNESLIEKISQIFGFSENDKVYATIIASISFKPDYGNLCAKAIRKILPYMKDGVNYNQACEYVGYRKRSLTKEELANKIYKEHLEVLPKNSLRNPIVEKILNQMVNVVNSVIDRYGKLDEIRIEMARELKMNADRRADMTSAISKTTAENEEYRKIIHDKFGIVNVSRNDVLRYRLYLELKDNGFRTLYSNTYIPQEKLFSNEFDIEHIIPKAKLFDNFYSNKTLESKDINIEKKDATAFDFILTKYGDIGLEQYKNRVENLFKNGDISRTKRSNLLMKEAEIPSDFIQRDLNDTQYIAKKAREILEDVVKFVTPTIGPITDRLREDWQLVNVMQELNWDKYEKLGLTEYIEDKDGRKIPRIKDWTKRNDNRHHAMDALAIAFTKLSIIQYLNNLNAHNNKSSDISAIERKELYRDEHHHLIFNPPMPLNEFRAEAKKQLESLLISTKSRNKVVTRNINRTKGRDGIREKMQLTPRGQLHNETIYGSIKRYATKKEKVGANFDAEHITMVANKKYREALMQRLASFGNDAKNAFTGKNSLEKNPLYVDELHTVQVPSKVELVSFETVYTIRKAVTPDLKIEKVIAKNIRKILQNRLDEFGGDAKKAFSNLDENPIWQNEGKGICIKCVTISGINNAEAIHYKRDKTGEYILNEKGHKGPADYVNTGNNHHAAIYCDSNGNLHEKVVSFYEATSRAIQNLPIVDKDYMQSEGWHFLFSIKQNEYFVFPDEKIGFYPKEVDLKDPQNYAIISKNLYRVQKLATKDYFFRHHLETTVENKNVLKDISWKRITSLDIFNEIVKVRINHIGEIVSVGEY
jgi:CRISPR-associated endonuclease Csn1